MTRTAGRHPARRPPRRQGDPGRVRVTGDPTDVRAVRDRAEDLLRAYRPGGSWFFSSPRHALLAEGVAETLAAPPGTGLGTYAAGVLGSLAGEHPAPVVVGALPFDLSRPAHLVVPAVLRRSGPLTAPVGRRAVPTGIRYDVRPVPAPQAYAAAVAAALGPLRSGALDKVVLARTLELTAAAPVDAGAVLRALAAGDPRAYVFATDLPAGGVLLGASPELLVSRTGTTVVAHPLAGSAARSADPGQDAALAAGLDASAKNRREHALVVDTVVEALRPLSRRLDVPAEPSLVGTARMWHLGTRITAELADPATTALTVAEALHPTAAVCGLPPAAARAAIAELEPFDRGFYSGLVGWVDAAGDGEWALSLRCAEVRDRELRLFAGAGIVAASDPAAELAETTAKFRTLLDALGVRDEP